MKNMILPAVRKVAAVLAALPLFAYAEFQVGNLYFTEPDSSGEVSVARCEDNIETATIPASVIYTWTEYVKDEQGEWVPVKHSRVCPVTSIGRVAFLNGRCVLDNGYTAYYSTRGQNLRNVFIPGTVRNIGGGAFFGCWNLKEVSLPNSVTNISEKAFEDAGLKSIAMPEGVVCVEGDAFQGCYDMEYVSIPASLKKLGGGVFRGNTNIVQVSTASLDDWCHIDFAGNESNPLFVANSAVLEINGHELEGSITLPDDMTKISGGLFKGCSKLTEIDIPQSVENIGDYAFASCTSLQGFDFPESVTNINGYAFANCTSLKEVIVPDSVINIERGVFAGCVGITRMTLPFVGRIKGYGNTGKSGYYSDGLFGIIFGSEPFEGGRKVDQEYDFSYPNYYTTHWSTLTSYIPTNLTEIIVTGETLLTYHAFQNCQDLKKVEFTEALKFIGQEAFAFCSSLESISLPSTFATSYGDAFIECDNLKEVHIEDLSAWSMAGFANNRAQPLRYAHNLYLGDMLLSGDIVIDGVESISPRAFAGCTCFESVTIAGEAKSIGYEAFSGCWGITNVVFEEGVENIYEYAFQNCKDIESISLPSSLKTLSYSAFNGADNLKAVNIADIDSYCRLSIPNYLQNERFLQGELLYNGAPLSGDLVIPDGVTSIARYMFAGCSNLTSVTIPSSVTTIGDQCFSGCVGLKRMTIPYLGKFCRLFGDSYVEGTRSIDNGGYNNGGYRYVPTNLTEIVIIDAESIPESEFQWCVDIQHITLPANLKNISSKAFYGCTSLVDVTIPSSVTNIANWAFRECDNLTDITIPGSVDTVETYVFYGCDNLTNVVVESGVQNIWNDAFSSCPRLVSVKLPKSMYGLWAAFKNCPALERVDMPESLSVMSGSIFTGCSQLKECKIPDGAGEIPSSMFYGCSSLADVAIPSSVTNIGNSAFYNCTSLEEIAIPSGVANIEHYVFYNCASLEQVTIPASVASIGSEAFGKCTGLKRVHVEDLDAWCRISFSNQTANPLNFAKEGLYVDGEPLSGKVVIPEGVTNIEECLFAFCGGVTQIEIPETVASIDVCAFAWCSGLTRVFVPASVTSIASHAFANCQNLQVVYIPNGAKNNVNGNALYGSPSSAQKVFYEPPFTVVRVTLDADGGSVDTQAVEAIAGANIGALPTPSRSIDIFVGWFTDKTGGEEVTADTIVSSDMTIYARWREGRMWTNAGSSHEIWNGAAINESNFDFKIPASATLPAGSVLRIRKIAFASLNSSFVVWDSTTSKGDTYYVRLNGVNSKLVNGAANSNAAALVDDRKVQSNNVTSDYALEFEFDTPCLVEVGKLYPAVSGNNYGGVGDGIALLWSNGLLIYGSNADRASVRYVKTGETADIISTPTAKSITGEDGYYPVFSIQAEVVSVMQVAAGVLAGENEVRKNSDGSYLVTAAEGMTLNPGDISVAAIVDGVAVDTTRGYDIVISENGATATVTLKHPEIGFVAKEEGDVEERIEGDFTGVLVSVEESKLDAKPKLQDGESLGALPVKAVRGLYYQAAWGGDLDAMTEGEKIQATGDSLYMGVVKQTGFKGFYKLSVSED